MDTFREITEKMPFAIEQILKGVPSSIIHEIEEIRLRCGQNVRLQCGTRERSLPCQVSREDLQKTLNNLIQFSYYAYEEDLAKGFVTIEGGHRVGICGKAVVKKGQPGLIKEISSLNIRFAKEVKGCASKVMGEIIVNRRPVNTLIISPPGCGKTTLLRDIARELSYGRCKVAICDERSELAGMYHAKPSFDLGPRCDVLDGCEKSYGIPMLIRSMSPQVIITDEIGKSEDISAAQQCLVSGVTLITSIHGASYEDIENSNIGQLVSGNFFQRLIYLTNEKGAGSVKEIVYA